MSSRFEVDEPVRARVTNPAGHTRLPGYVRGRRGTIESVRRAMPLPDQIVHGSKPAEPVPLYAVRFAMSELWGPDAEAGSELVMELWEPYLEPAPHVAGDDHDGRS